MDFFFFIIILEHMEFGDEILCDFRLMILIKMLDFWIFKEAKSPILDTLFFL